MRIAIDAHRRPARARNVEARLGRAGRRVVVTAHVDSKPGTPGALDNAAGVVAALQLAALLSGPLAAGRGEPPAVEIVVVNGEDYFSAAGEVDWLRRNGGLDAPLTDVALAVNIDAAGFRRDDVAWSGYNLDAQPAERVRSLLARPGLTEGEQWWQSDHAVFAMRGRPALAFTSSSMTELLATLVHTPGDTPAVVDPASLALTASAIADVISAID